MPVRISSVTQCVQLLVTPWTAAHQASLSTTSSWNLLKLVSIESVMPSNHLILGQTLLLPPSIFTTSTTWEAPVIILFLCMYAQEWDCRIIS